MPRLASRAPLARSTRKPATLVVPRSTASPSVRLPGGGEADQLAPAQVRAQRPVDGRADTPGNCRAAARSTASGGAAGRAAPGRRRRDVSDSVAAATLTARAAHGRVERRRLRSGRWPRRRPARSAPASARRPRSCSRRAGRSGRRAAISSWLPPRRGLLVLPLVWRRSPCDHAPSRCRRCRGRRRRRRCARRCGARIGRCVSPGCVDLAVELRKAQRVRACSAADMRCCMMLARCASGCRRHAAAASDLAFAARRAVVAARPARRRQIDADAEHHRDRFQRAHELAGGRGSRRSSPHAASRSTAACASSASPGSPARSSPAIVSPRRARPRACGPADGGESASSNSLPSLSSASASDARRSREQRAHPLLRAPARACTRRRRARSARPIAAAASGACRVSPPGAQHVRRRCAQRHDRDN